MLQYQNHKLAQQLEHQRSEISALESKCCQFKSKQASYDDTLIAVNRAWDLVSEIFTFWLSHTINCSDYCEYLLCVSAILFICNSENYEDKIATMGRAILHSMNVAHASCFSFMVAYCFRSRKVIRTHTCLMACSS